MDNNKHICRGKRDPDGRWFEGYYVMLQGIDAPLHLIIDRTGQYIKVFPETVGRCTGFLDKEGRLIFEGDILKDDDIEAPLVVRYSENLASFVGETEDTKVLWAFTELDSSDIEIVGCVHEISR